MNENNFWTSEQRLLLEEAFSFNESNKNCNIICFTKSWLNDDMKNIELAGFTLYRQDRTETYGKTRGGGLCIFVNNSWCRIRKSQGFAHLR
jgi:hypothetical protein